jgi:hypothetical protein
MAGQGRPGLWGLTSGLELSFYPSCIGCSKGVLGPAHKGLLVVLQGLLPEGLLVQFVNLARTAAGIA